MKTIVIALAWSFWAGSQIHGASANEWTTAAPREEIRPQFQQTATGGKSGHGALAIRADEREGLHGWWQKSFSVTAGQHYRFSAIDRKKGFAGSIAAHPEMKIIAAQSGDFETGKGKEVMETLLQQHGKDVTAVYAHNDN